MRRKALSVAEAKATLSDAIRDVEAGTTVVITRHGKPVVALVRTEHTRASAFRWTRRRTRKPRRRLGGK